MIALPEKPMSSALPKVGIVSDSAFQRHMIVGALQANGVIASAVCPPEGFSELAQERLSAPDCWIVVIEDEEASAFDVSELFSCIDELGKPILFGLGLAPQKQQLAYISWERRLISKLEDCLGCLSRIEDGETLAALKPLEQDHLASDNVLRPAAPQKSSLGPSLDRPVREVWVLAASLGGPAAVKEFLDELPADLDVAFLYAQHVDEHFSKVLTQVLGRHAELDLVAMEDQKELRAGEVQVVPVGHQVHFETGAVRFSENQWPGPYGPSIDQLLLNVHEGYGPNCHVVMFSGMGNDGALAAAKLHEAGCQVWAQTPETCANASMPQSVIDLSCVQLVGAPKELARALIARSRTRSA